MYIERRLQSNPQLHQHYSEFISENLSLGHMEEIPEDEILQSTSVCFYLPHHAVYKMDSSPTKIRVVFDGSAKNANPDIFSVSIRFRRHAYVMSGDIEKMEPTNSGFA